MNPTPHLLAIGFSTADAETAASFYTQTLGFERTQTLTIDAGAYADLVLFDPATVKDAATYEAPTKVSEGIVETWINGQSAYVHGQGATNARAGRLVSRNRA